MITTVDDPGRVVTYESLLHRAWSKPDRGSSSGPNLVRAIVKGPRRARDCLATTLRVADGKQDGAAW